jgi:hypothetical protein
MSSSMISIRFSILDTRQWIWIRLQIIRSRHASTVRDRGESFASVLRQMGMLFLASMEGTTDSVTPVVCADISGANSPAREL